MKYRTNSKTGNGTFNVSLKESLDPFLKTDITTDCEVRLSQREINISMTRIQGENLTGNGIIVISIDPANFNNSQLSGNLRLNSGNAPLQIKVSGTISNPSAVPAIGMELRSVN
jgi:hypothetical protein